MIIRYLVAAGVSSPVWIIMVAFIEHYYKIPRWVVFSLGILTGVIDLTVISLIFVRYHL